MSIYTTLNGYKIELGELEQPHAEFLARVEAAVADSKTKLPQVIALVYGAENPILDQHRLPGRSMVTQAVLDNPLYHVLCDLIGRKEVACGAVDLEKAHAAYTVDVPTAAKQLDITLPAVRAAIDSRRLPAVYRGGQWWLRPEAIASFVVSKAGRPKKLQKLPIVTAKVGGSKGASLSVRINDGKMFGGQFSNGWTTAIIKTTSDAGTRAFVIEPSTDTDSIEHGELFIRGGFKIVKKLNQTAAAQAEWKSWASTQRD
jgi:hypothetical protein